MLYVSPSSVFTSVILLLLPLVARPESEAARAFVGPSPSVRMAATSSANTPVLTGMRDPSQKAVRTCPRVPSFPPAACARRRRTGATDADGNQPLLPRRSARRGGMRDGRGKLKLEEGAACRDWHTRACPVQGFRKPARASLHEDLRCHVGGATDGETGGRTRPSHGAGSRSVIRYQVRATSSRLGPIKTGCNT